jgi:two-component sensor histidine kinase
MSAPPCGVVLRAEGGDALKLTISDNGKGPNERQARPGLGSRIIDAFSTQLGARVEPKRTDSGFRIELTVPLHTPR